MTRWFPLTLLLPVAACATTTTERLGLPPLAAVEHVDLTRYAGTWYEIANFPQSFQRGCTATTAHYTLRDDGEVDVVNRCRRGGLDGREDEAHGRARVADQGSTAKLEVSFFRPFWGAYWVIDLGPAYEYAVVGHPGRDYLWILSRTPALDSTTYEAILTRLRDKGYPLDRLQETLQPGGAVRETSALGSGGPAQGSP